MATCRDWTRRKIPTTWIIQTQSTCGQPTKHAQVQWDMGWIYKVEQIIKCKGDWSLLIGWTEIHCDLTHSHPTQNSFPTQHGEDLTSTLDNGCQRGCVSVGFLRPIRVQGISWQRRRVVGRLESHGTRMQIWALCREEERKGRKTGLRGKKIQPLVPPCSLPGQASLATQLSPSAELWGAWLRAEVG